MITDPKYTQREYMILLAKSWGYNRAKIIAKYARAERNGLVVRYSDIHNTSREAYAARLYSDGISKGWLYAWAPRDLEIPEDRDHRP